MAINVIVRSRTQIIAPLRFARAVSGEPIIDAPDIDDRGFVMGTRPETWGATPIRGAMIGMTVGDTVRIKVVTEDIEDESLEQNVDSVVPLFVTSTDRGVVEVVNPAGGGPLGVDGAFSIRGKLDTIRRPVTVQVRLGGIDGPVIGELEPHVFTLRSLRIRVHFVEIGGVKPQRDAKTKKQGEPEQEVASLFRTANAIWRPAGIEFNYDPSNPQQTQREDVQLTAKGKVTVFKRSDPQRAREVSRIYRTRPDKHSINVYFVHRIVFIDDNNVEQETTAGLTADNDVQEREGHGVLIADPDVGADGTVLAHELGHYLDLDDHSDENSERKVIRTDMWSVRRLMFSRLPPSKPPHRNDVGYGSARRGALLTLKNLDADPNDGEVARARRRALNAF